MSDDITKPAALSSRKWTHDWTDFKLKNVLKEVEGKYIRAALRDASGSVTRASKLLGTTHQLLISKLKKHHSDLASERTPARQRNRPQITRGSKHKSVQRRQEAAESAGRHKENL